MPLLQSKPFKSNYFTGLFLIIFSFVLYLLSKNYSETGKALFSFSFLVIYCISFGYLFFLYIEKISHKEPRPNIPYTCWINVVVLFTISAFSLNQDMNIFSTFPDWLNAYTILTVGLFLLYPYFNHLPSFLKPILFFFTGSSILLSVYMIIYLLPLVPLSLIAFLFFGFSLHTLVPAIWLWVQIDFLIRKTPATKLKHLIWIGFCLPVCLLGFYLIRWYNIQNQIKDVLASQNLQLKNHLPDGILLAQKLPSDPITEEIILSPIKSQRFWANGFLFDRTGEDKFHDPLALCALELFGELNLKFETVETLLNIRKDHRHKSSRRLWTGTSLSTDIISNNIRIYPEYRLAYHEKTLVIQNNPSKKTRGAWFSTNTQEAIYTFHLPEGSIVTSLSLWINGKEEKSRLSTKQKADSAYTQKVGVEQRDPALVHWKEGNTVTVSIFPCTSEEDRKFKIGFTTPLTVKDNTTWLENIWFEGPDKNKAREATCVVIEGDPAKTTYCNIPSFFNKNAKGELIYTGDYLPDWKIGIKTTELSKNKFSFNGYTYSLKNAEIKKLNVNINKVFLDITKEWNQEEYNALLKNLSNKEVYTWLPEKVKITSENKDLVWNEVSSNLFSMPFLYDVIDPENSVIITKSGALSPVLSELAGSDYAQKNLQYLSGNNKKVTVFNIGNELSPLWKSMRELRLIEYSSAPFNEVIANINSGSIPVLYEDSTRVSLNESGMSIIKEKAEDNLTKGHAPDHLMRLFAYNDILRKIGNNYFEKEKYENDLFREAEEAYVVTPVTSMLVLENEADYKQMGIAENKNTVGNAGIISGGAVPEPHEWALIILVLILIVRHLYLQNKNRKWKAY